MSRLILKVASMNIALFQSMSGFRIVMHRNIENIEKSICALSKYQSELKIYMYFKTQALLLQS